MALGSGDDVGLLVGTRVAKGSGFARLSVEFVDDLMLQNELELV